MKEPMIATTACCYILSPQHVAIHREFRLLQEHPLPLLSRRIQLPITSDPCLRSPCLLYIYCPDCHKVALFRGKHPRANPHT